MREATPGTSGSCAGPGRCLARRSDGRGALCRSCRAGSGGSAGAWERGRFGTGEGGGGRGCGRMGRGLGGWWWWRFLDGMVIGTVVNG